MSSDSDPTPRLQLRRTRRGWIVGVMAAMAGGALLHSGTGVGAGNNDPSCKSIVATTTTTTTTTETTPADASVAPDPQTSTVPAVVEQPPTETTAVDPASDKPVDPETATDAAPVVCAPVGGQVLAPPPSDDAPAAADRPKGAPSVESQQPQAASGSSESAQPADHVTRSRHAKGGVEPAANRRHHARHHHRSDGRPRPAAQVYFPPVSVDWEALTPLAPPPLPGLAAKSFPGPEVLLPIYQAAATSYNVPWQVLAAINEVESNWGHNTGPSSAGAIGWMQFLPSTWQTYGLDVNGDGLANPEDPVDAIFSAARYLHAAGATKDLGRAIFAYNHANWYVDDVVRRAIELGSIPQDVLTALTEKGRSEARSIRRASGETGMLKHGLSINSLGRVLLLADGRLNRHILHSTKMSIYECGREDIAAGVIDRRVLEVLQYLAAHGLHPTVTSLRCGHGYYTSSGNVSEHSSGDAVDISAINGIPILGHQGPGSITEKTIKQLLKLSGVMKPHQIISLMTFTGAENTLSLPDHANHIHIGFAPERPIAAL